VTSGGSSVSIHMVGTYTSNSFTKGHDAGGHLELSDPPVVAQGGFGTPATLGYAQDLNRGEHPFAAGENDIANVALLQQHMTAQFALVTHDQNAPLGAAAVSGSSALLAHGNG
jgi:hypothetical protein